MPEAAPSVRSAEHDASASGVGFAVSCYLVWGVVPIYWKAPIVVAIPAFEVLIPRIVWTLILLIAVARSSGRWGEIWPERRREWGWSLVAALLLSLNWTVFIYAVQSDQIIATSLGYYINPLVSVLLGLLILGERLGRAQALAIAIAALGVAAMTLRVGALPWVSLVLAVSFGLYGLIHKLHPQPPLGGLLREMLVLLPLAAGALSLLAASGPSKLLEASVASQAYLSLTGVVTAVPLLLFHAATRRLPLVSVGMFQYIAPTISLGIATALYDEPFTGSHALGFGLVWIGLVVFSFDSLRRSRQPDLSRPGDGGSR